MPIITIKRKLSLFRVITNLSHNAEQEKDDSLAHFTIRFGAKWRGKCNPEKGDGYIQERRLEIKPAEGPDFQGMAP